MAESSAEKTEQPTGKRLGDARSKGQVAQSEELTSFFSIVILITMIAFLAPDMMQWFVGQLKDGLSYNANVFSNSGDFGSFLNAKIIDSLLIMSPILLALVAGSFVSGILIHGWNFSTGAIRLDFNALNPVSGVGSLINARAMVKFLISVLKLFFVSFIVWLYIKKKVDVFATLRWTWSLQLLTIISKIILGLMIRICVALLVIAAADTIYQKWKYIKDLKMTKLEVKEERRSSEGSPEVKKRMRQLQFQTAYKHILQEVPKANVVLVNPTHVAVALRYEAKEMESPVLVAKGAEHLAEKIREVARAYGIPIIRRPELARTIYSTLEPGEPIPDILYVAVAEVLALIHRLRHRR